MTVATIARRSLTDAELSDATCTPQWLCDMLPPVDVDPCSNERSNVKCRWSFSLEKSLDGLKLPWLGSAFINWPYSDPLEWAIKAIAELGAGRCTEAIILCKLDSSTEWWDIATGWDPEAVPGEPLCQPPDLWLFKRRIQHDEHPELIARRIKSYEEDKAAGRKTKSRKNGKSSNNFASAIIHHRQIDGLPLNLSSVATPWWRAF